MEGIGLHAVGMESIVIISANLYRCVQGYV